MLFLARTAIMLSKRKGDGAIEARAGYVLHLSRGALPGVLNIKWRGERCAGGATRPALLILAFLYFSCNKLWHFKLYVSGPRSFKIGMSTPIQRQRKPNSDPKTDCFNNIVLCLRYTLKPQWSLAKVKSVLGLITSGKCIFRVQAIFIVCKEIIRFKMCFSAIYRCRYFVYLINRRKRSWIRLIEPN